MLFFHLCKLLFSDFLQFKGKFVDGQNDSKYCDGAPLNFPAMTDHINLVLPYGPDELILNL